MLNKKSLNLLAAAIIPLLAVSAVSYAVDGERAPLTSTQPAVITLPPAVSAVSVDPALAAAQDPKNQEIAELNAKVKSLQDELKKAREAMGVTPDKIPAVPSKVVTAGVPEYQTQQSNDLTVTPGVNQIVTIAVGHTNRLITPFSHPQVSSATLSGGDAAGTGGEVSIKDNVVYISTNKVVPISMFITDKGNENVAISLTLLPRKIPSREVHLTLNTQDLQTVYGSSEAEKWEKSQPYVSGIKKALREIALQRVPSGYQLTSIPKNYALPSCSAQGFRVDFSKGQLMAGSKLHYIVGKVTNVSAHTLEFRESSCANYDIAAVALWPNNMLEPGQSSEIYVVRHAPGRQEMQQVRTSVLAK